MQKFFTVFLVMIALLNSGTVGINVANRDYACAAACALVTAFALGVARLARQQVK